MIHEAIDTLFTLGWALLGWVLVFALAGTIVLLAGLALGTWAVKQAWRHLPAPSWARGRLRARIHVRHRLKRSSGHTDDHEYQEAA